MPKQAASDSTEIIAPVCDFSYDTATVNANRVHWSDKALGFKLDIGANNIRPNVDLNGKLVCKDDIALAGISGVVHRSTENCEGYTNTILWIYNSDRNLSVAYRHVDFDDSITLAEGATVNAGDVVARISNKGCTGGYKHIHLTVHRGNSHYPNYLTYDSDYVDTLNQWEFGAIEPPVPPPPPFIQYKNPREAADINGDGKDDIVGFGNNGIYVALTKPDGTGVIDLNGNGTPDVGDATNWSPEMGTLTQSWDETKHVRTFADIDGDGDDDAVGFYTDGVRVLKSLGKQGTNGFDSNYYYWSYEFGNNSGWTVDKNIRTFADIDNDGDEDIVGFYDTKVILGISLAKQGENRFQRVDTTFTNMTYNGGWFVDKNPRMAADVTGDGRADLIGFGNYDLYVAKAKSTEPGFEPAVSWSTTWQNTMLYGTGNSWLVSKHPRMTGDINGDGRIDLVGFGEQYVYVAYNDGTKFLNPVIWFGGMNQWSGWEVSKHPRVIGNMDGVNGDDVVGYGSHSIYVVRDKTTNIHETWLNGNLVYDIEWR